MGRKVEVKLDSGAIIYVLHLAATESLEDLPGYPRSQTRRCQTGDIEGLTDLVGSIEKLHDLSLQG
jgi:hypothetical protein